MLLFQLNIIKTSELEEYKGLKESIRCFDTKEFQFKILSDIFLTRKTIKIRLNLAWLRIKPHERTCSKSFLKKCLFTFLSFLWIVRKKTTIQKCLINTFYWGSIFLTLSDLTGPVQKPNNKNQRTQICLTLLLFHS